MSPSPGRPRTPETNTASSDDRRDFVKGSMSGIISKEFVQQALGAENAPAEAAQRVGEATLHIAQRSPGESMADETARHPFHGLEAPQDTPEVDPKKEFFFAGGWGDILSPKDGGSGYGVTQYNPRQKESSLIRGKYRVETFEEDERLPVRVVRLLGNRRFAWTGEIPEVLEGYEGLKPNDKPFYQEKRTQIIAEEKPGETAGTLVRVDGYSVLALGHVDLEGTNRGRLSFAAKGNLSVREILRRARAIFPETFEEIDRQNIILQEEAYEIIDLE